jgi:lipopolysaccharide cholinephosphotransferase
MSIDKKYFLTETQKIVLYEIAENVSKILDKHGINYWIDGGTLLGALRHKDVIPWDYDLDFGMMENDFFTRLPTIYPELEALGFEITIRYHIVKIYMPSRNMTNFGDALSRSCPTLDIFPYHRNDHLIELHHEKHRQTWPEATHKYDCLFPLKEYEFGPITLKGPNNGVPYCDNLYPNWKVKAVLDTPKSVLHIPMDFPDALLHDSE